MVKTNEIRPGSYATKPELAEVEEEGGVTKEYVDTEVAKKQNTLTAGANITIEGDVISATDGDTRYSAGSGIAISSENVISNSAPNVQADWNAVSGDAVILNKPAIPAAQVQADWNEADSGAVDYIKNKPTIPAAQVNSDWNAASGVAQILNKPTIPSGNDLVPSTTGATQGDVLTIGASGPEWAGASAPSNMMTTDTAQDVTASKTFKSVTKFQEYGSNKTQLSIQTISNPAYCSLTFDTRGPTTSTTDGGSVQCSTDGVFLSKEKLAGQYNAKLSLGIQSTDWGIHQKTQNTDSPDVTAPNNVGTASDTLLATRYWTDSKLSGKANMTKAAGAPTTATVGAEADFYYDTTNDKLYQCTAVTGDGGNPEVFTYTWTEVGGGSAPSNMVTTDTAQTITGIKEFKQSASGMGGYIKHNGRSLSIGSSDSTNYTPTASNLPTYGGMMYLSTSGTNGGGILHIQSAVKNEVTSSFNTGCGITLSGNAGSGMTPYIGFEARHQGLNGVRFATTMVNFGHNNNFPNNLMYGGFYFYLPEFYQSDTALPVTPATFELYNQNNDWKRFIPNLEMVTSYFPNNTITGDDTTTVFTVSHGLGRMPGIVQVTNDTTGAVEDVQIVKSTTDVTVTFTSAPANGDTYTVAMLY